MAPSIPPLPFRKVKRLLEQHGFHVLRQRGSHVLFGHADGRSTLVPDHRGRDIPPGLVRKVLRDAEIDPDSVRR